jgi:hypothetical protein
MDIQRFKDYTEAEQLWTAEQLFKLSREVKGLLERVRTELVNAAHQIDETVVKPLPDESSKTTEEQRQVARAALSSSVLVAALTIGQVQQQFTSIAAHARGLLQRALQWFLKHLFNVLNAVTGHLNVENWSIEASGGFPWGVNMAIALTFK